MITDTKDLRTVGWLAERTDIPRRTLYYNIGNGKIPSIQICGVTFVNESALPDWVTLRLKKAKK